MKDETKTASEILNDARREANRLTTEAHNATQRYLDLVQVYVDGTQMDKQK